MRKIFICSVIISSLTLSFGCTTPQSYHGGAIGAVMGGLSGALLTPRNPLAGGVIGAMIGGTFGASIAEISAQAAREAAISNKPVRYVSEDRRVVYIAKPLGHNRHSRCRKVREKVWKNNRLILTRTISVCI